MKPPMPVRMARLARFILTIFLVAPGEAYLRKCALVKLIDTLVLTNILVGLSAVQL